READAREALKDFAAGGEFVLLVDAVGIGAEADHRDAFAGRWDGFLDEREVGGRTGADGESDGGGGSEANGVAAGKGEAIGVHGGRGGVGGGMSGKSGSAGRVSSPPACRQHCTAVRRRQTFEGSRAAAPSGVRT